MTAEPWFDPNLAGWIGGIVGTVGGLWGSALGFAGSLLVPKGRGKGFVFGLLVAGLVAGVVSLIAGLVALTAGQPYGVWYVLLLPGVLMSVLAGVFVFVARHRYRQVELRKMQADELGA